MGAERRVDGARVCKWGWSVNIACIKSLIYPAASHVALNNGVHEGQSLKRSFHIKDSKAVEIISHSKCK